jgi:pilus assembly protein Flp/PilA
MLNRLFVARAAARDAKDDGASAVEYGLLVAAIAAIIILVVFALGTFVKGSFKDTCSGFKNSNSVNSAAGANNDCTQ